jgi:SWI/SNF-related matrix-associated actin-dependent regulator of chromatin subfamily A member 5
VLKIEGGKDERTQIVREKLLAGVGDYEVVLASYETVVLERASLRKISWTYVVVDEAQRIKNDKSILAQALRTLSSQARLLIVR